MGNKYGSNLRTYTARNLVWDCSGAQPVPFTMAAPQPLVIQTPNSAKNSMLLSVYNFNSSLIAPEALASSYLNIKRAGLFCNFADGLVSEMNKSRVTFKITVGEYLLESKTGIMNFTALDNEIIATGQSSLLSTSQLMISRNGRAIPIYTPPPVPAGTGYLTDYNDVTGLLTPFQVWTPTGVSQDFTIKNIATLNTMYEAEIFCKVVASTASPFNRVLILCQLGVDSSEDSLDYFTNIIDPSFNGQAISFDSVIELEVTPV